MGRHKRRRKHKARTPQEKLRAASAETAEALNDFGRAFSKMISAMWDVINEAFQQPEVQEALQEALQEAARRDAEEAARLVDEENETPLLLPAHGQYHAECEEFRADCLCGTCQWDHFGDKEAQPCCHEHSLDCGFKQCPDYTL